MEPRDRELLNAYHKEVYNKISISAGGRGEMAGEGDAGNLTLTISENRRHIISVIFI